MKRVKRETKPNHIWLWISLPTALLVVVYVGFRVRAGNNDPQRAAIVKRLGGEMYNLIESQQLDSIDPGVQHQLAVIGKTMKQYNISQTELDTAVHDAENASHMREKDAASRQGLSVEQWRLKTERESERARKIWEQNQKPRHGSREWD